MRIVATLLTAGLVSAPLMTRAAHAFPGSDFKGAPTFKPGEALGAFFWEDDTGLHARFTTDGKAPRHVIGKVCAQTIARLDAVELEETDKLELGGAGKCVHFDFQIDGAVDGYDFAATGPGLKFQLEVDGQALATDKIWLGKDGKHPRTEHFAVEFAR